MKKGKKVYEDEIKYDEPSVNLYDIQSSYQFRKTIKQKRQDPVLTKCPDPPVPGPLGKRGKISEGTITAFVLKSVRPLKKAGENARDELLRFANYAEKCPEYVQPA